MSLITEPYLDQVRLWPESGRHILAQHDDETIVVYQAYRPSAGRFAAENGYFGKDFSYARMSWIKPNFLWMAYRSGWGTKEGQEVTLALRLRRSFFDGLLVRAVPSSWDPAVFSTRQEWSEAVRSLNVRLQWDPDHDPLGAPLTRRAIQIGLRGDALEAYGRRELLSVTDVSDFVAEQRECLASGGIAAVSTPRERIYVPSDRTIATRIGLDS